MTPYLSITISIMKRSLLTLVGIVMAISTPSPALASIPGENSQSSIKTDKNLFYRQPVPPEEIDNYLYSIIFSNNKNIYNLKGFELTSTPMKVVQLKVNPAGHSVAALVSNGKKSRVVAYDLNSVKNRVGQLKDFDNPTAIAYTSDSRLLAVADGNSLELFDSRKMKPAGVIPVGIAAEFLEAKPNASIIAAAAGKDIEIVSTESGKVVQKITLPSPVKALSFDPSGAKLAAISGDGKMTIFDGFTFQKLQELTIPANATSVSFHPDMKYVAVANNGKRITFVNLIEPSDTTSISDPEGRLKYARFIRDGKGTDFIAYAVPSALKYKRISGFAPNFTKLLEDELNARMAAWSKMRPFETEEEYAARVNEETKAKQKQLFANEIATSLAGDLMEHADVTLGNYNPESGLLALSIGGMQNVYLPVPQDEATNFGDGKNLEFRNAVYGLTPDDKFELIYAEVYNPTTGKSYTFDNLDRQSLDFLATDDSFISLDLIRQSSREDARLQDIRDDILEQARKNSTISDHTKIDVSADIISDFDESGKRVNNYKVDFTYTVDPDFSATEDFAAGKYKISESPAAESMLAIVAKAFEGDFKQYVKEGKKLVVNLTGSADALPINGRLAYDGAFGEFDNEPCRIDGDLSSISVDSADGIKTNEQLAFIRAQAVKDNLLHGVPAISDMNVSYNYFIEVSKEKGGAHRRINVSFLFVDAF